ncbi:hypothetical protein [Timonella senegalensis]|uniref:hypothetical protein n=1 Tax=Timonella senegalensis TaxID=1465825 RepID=UPI002FDC9F38
MTIPQEAIEAGAQTLFEESQELDQDNSWDDELPEEWREAWRYAAQSALTAALPALERQIREQVAQEVEELKLNPKDSTTPHCVEEYNAGLTNAAKIARGKDQA